VLYPATGITKGEVPAGDDRWLAAQRGTAIHSPFSGRNGVAMGEAAGGMNFLAGRFAGIPVASPGCTVRRRPGCGRSYAPVPGHVWGRLLVSDPTRVLRLAAAH
jgi:hypothetical protein